MKVTITVEKEIELKTLVVKAKVRYWEDADVNGVSDEDGKLIPCRVGDIWQPSVDIDTGIIQNWEQGTTAEIHYKVCDCCCWLLFDDSGNIVLSVEDGYVPNTLCPKATPDGDYIVMDIDQNGKIDKWNFDIDDFQEDWE